jgi:hypothetical protein
MVFRYSWFAIRVDINPDININLPTTSARLKGSAYDANRDVLTIALAQVRGPNTATFNSTAITQPTVSDLKVGDFLPA